jgi:3-phosphoshikimate 1-carboxyvinyltransferase
MHERPIGDLVDALRQLGCDIKYLGNEGYPPLRIGRPALRAGRADPGARRRVQPVPDRACCWRCRWPGMAQARCDIVIEVVGELISKPYIEITLNLLARFGITVQRDGWQRFTIPPAAPTARRARSMSRPMPRRPATSSRWARWPPPRTAAHARRRRGPGSIQGDIRFVEAAQAMGATWQAARAGWRCARRLAAAAITWTATTSPTPR